MPMMHRGPKNILGRQKAVEVIKTINVNGIEHQVRTRFKIAQGHEYYTACGQYFTGYRWKERLPSCFDCIAANDDVVGLSEEGIFGRW